MVDRPILFSAPMVRALLDGRKTQTRRVLNPQPYDFVTDGKRYWNAAGCIGGRICISDRHLLNLHRQPTPGDRLYVREAWRTSKVADELKPSQLVGGGYSSVWYEADRNNIGLRGRPRAGMHMPRWASRLTLIVTDVRIERLQDISEADAIAEGIAKYPCEGPHRGPDATYWTAEQNSQDHIKRTTPLAAYAALWDNINGAGAWDANPWIVAVSFDMRKGNINV